MPQGDEVLIATHSEGTVAMDPDVDYVLVWQTSGYPEAVFGQRYAHPPTVQTSAFDVDAMTQELELRFSENVGDSLSVSDLRLVNLTTGQTIDPSAIAVSWDAATNTASFTFPGFRNGILPDGNYRATLPANSITDPAGNPMQTDATLDFFVLAGDANRDRKVDNADLQILAANWQATGKRFSEGDFSYDGKVDVTDLGTLATSWQKSLVTIPASLPVSSMPIALVPSHSALQARRTTLAEDVLS